MTMNEVNEDENENRSQIYVDTKILNIKCVSV